MSLKFLSGKILLLSGALFLFHCQAFDSESKGNSRIGRILTFDSTYQIIQLENISDDVEYSRAVQDLFYFAHRHDESGWNRYFEYTRNADGQDKYYRSIAEANWHSRMYHLTKADSLFQELLENEEISRSNELNQVLHFFYTDHLATRWQNYNSALNVSWEFHDLGIQKESEIISLLRLIQHADLLRLNRSYLQSFSFIAEVLMAINTKNTPAYDYIRGITYHVLGKVFASDNKLQLSEAYFRKSIDILREYAHCSDFALVLTNYAITKHQEAVESQQFEADEIKKTIQNLFVDAIAVQDSNDLMNYAYGYYRLGRLYASLGDFPQAIASLETGLKALGKIREKHPQKARMISYLGKVKYEQGEYDIALHFQQKAIIQDVNSFTNIDYFQNPAFFQVNSTYNIISFLFDKIQSMQKLNELKGHSYPILKTYRLIDSILQLKVIHVDDISDLHFADYYHEIYNGYLLELITHDSDSFEEEKYDVVLKSKTKNNLGYLSKSKREFLQSLGEQKTEIDKVLYQTNDFNNITDDYLIDNFHILDDITRKIRDGKSKLKDFDKEDVGRPERCFQDDLLVLNYFVTDSFALVCYWEEGEFNSRIKWTSDLSKKVKEFSEVLKKGNIREREQVDMQAYELYQELYPGNNLKEHPKTIIIIPDGILFRLPFEALFDGKGYLSDVSRVFYAYHDSSTCKLNRNINIKMVSGLYFTDRETAMELDDQNEYDELPYTFLETQALKEIFPDESVTLTGGFNLSKKFFQQNLTNSDILHFATHAVSDDKNRLGNFLVFRNGRNGCDSLFSYEIGNLDLSENAIVFLSACSSAVGKNYSARGEYSLSRSFIQAGSDVVISTRWPLADRDGYVFAKLFYSKLKSNGKIQLQDLNTTDIVNRESDIPISSLSTFSFWL